MNDPKLILLGGNRGKWKAGERLGEAPTMNGIEAWVYAFDGDYIEGAAAQVKDIQGYDIIIANYNFSEAKHFLSLCHNRDPRSKWVTLIEGDALDYLKPQAFMLELLDSSDLVGCINQNTEAFFKKFTTSRAKYIGIPYPVEGVRALSTPYAERRKEIFLAPMYLTRWLEYFCIRDLGIPMYSYERRLSRNKRTLMKILRQHRTIDPWYFHKKARSLYRDDSLKIFRDETLPNFFRRSGGAYLWLNLDQRYTWGRYVLDAAALQVPIITTKSTGHGETFFPLTTLDNEFELDKATELVQRLFSDKDFYDEVANVPIERFDHLRPDVKKKELIDILYPS